jgi:hypothetical protein
VSRFFFLVALAFFAACALAGESPATDTPAAKEQPPVVVLSAHFEVSRLGYTFFDMEIRPNRKITGWEVNVGRFGKLGVAMEVDKGQSFSLSHIWDTETARSGKVMKCSIVSIQVPASTGGVEQVLLDMPITFEAKLVERAAVKLDMPRLKDPSVRTTAEVITFFEKDGTYKADENRIYTLKELRSILGEPKMISQAVGAPTPMPQVFPPGFDAARIARIRALVAASNVGFPRRNLAVNYQCRDGVATADLKQLDYHENEGINDTIQLRIHTVQVYPSEKQSPAKR